MSNKVTLGTVRLGTVLAYTATKQGILQVIAHHRFQVLEVLNVVEWTLKVVCLLSFLFIFYLFLMSLYILKQIVLLLVEISSQQLYLQVDASRHWNIFVSTVSVI